MTRASADAVLDRMESDEDFAVRVRETGGPESALALLRAEGFEVTPEEMRDAVLDRYGDTLTAEQLDALAGGATNDDLRVALDLTTGAAVGAVVVLASVVAAV